MDYFYDGQVRRYITQFINLMSNFAYKDAKGTLVRIPVRYGDVNRQVAQIINKNSENAIPSAPFIACYIKDLQFDRARLQDPTFISKIHIREREFDSEGQEYLNVQGNNYTVERIMPSPYIITFVADIWTTNTEMKFQIWEQLVVFFNPSFEIQTTDNYIDWTSLSVVHLERQTFSSRTIPQGISQDIDICSLEFTAPIWITPPAKIRKLGIITKIISNIFAQTAKGTIGSIYDKEGAAEIFNELSPESTLTVTPGNYSLLVFNSTARLVLPASNETNIDLTNSSMNPSWMTVLDLYPGKFKAGLSQLRFAKPGESEVIAYISLDPANEQSMLLNIDNDTIPTNTVISGRGSVDAIVNPETYDGRGKSAGTRYLILDDINNTPLFGTVGFDGPEAWKNLDGSDFKGFANDIIEWDGSSWNTVFDSSASTSTVYITNSYTGVQYKWEDETWSKSFEGIYENRLWRLIL